MDREACKVTLHVIVESFIISCPSHPRQYLFFRDDCFSMTRLKTAHGTLNPFFLLASTVPTRRGRALSKGDWNSLFIYIQVTAPYTHPKRSGPDAFLAMKRSTLRQADEAIRKCFVPVSQAYGVSYSVPRSVGPTSALMPRSSEVLSCSMISR